MSDGRDESPMRAGGQAAFSPARPRVSAYSGVQFHSDRKPHHMMTDEAYIAAYQKLSNQYGNNQSSMGDYLAAIQKLKEQYLKGKSSTALPAVP